MSGACPDPNRQPSRFRADPLVRENEARKSDTRRPDRRGWKARACSPRRTGVGRGTTQMDVPVFNMQGKEVGKLAIDEGSLGGMVNPSLIKQAFVRYHANTRQGSARTKNRREAVAKGRFGRTSSAARGRRRPWESIDHDPVSPGRSNRRRRRSRMGFNGPTGSWSERTATQSPAATDRIGPPAGSTLGVRWR